MRRSKNHPLFSLKFVFKRRTLFSVMAVLCATGLLWPGVARRVEAGGESAAALWTPVNNRAARIAQRAAKATPRDYKTFRLRRDVLEELLRQAPVEFTQSAQKRVVELPVPLPDGTLSRFRVVASSVMELELAARFPDIKTYAGQGLDEPTATARFAWTPQGFHATILSEKGAFYVEPVATGDNENYLVYAAENGPDEVSFSCATHGDAPAIRHGQTRPKVTISGGVKRYRLAVAATGEYTQTYGGGTVNGALAAITTLVNSVNALYERDLGVRVVLVANETSVIFTDPASDGYSSNNIAALLDENRSRLDAVLGSGGYDVGHVLDGHSISGGFSFQGLAYIGVVLQFKLQGRRRDDAGFGAADGQRCHLYFSSRNGPPIRRGAYAEHNRRRLRPGAFAHVVI